MAAKLKSIIRSTPWFLIGKAVVLGALWLSPSLWWLFVLLTLYFYFAPSLYSLKLGVPLVAVLGLSLVLDRSFVNAALIAIFLFLILGVKELVLVNRARAYRVLAALLAIAILNSFFLGFRAWNGALMIVSSWAIGVVLFLLLKDALGYEAVEAVSKEQAKRFGVAAGVVSFLAWQLAVAVLFLPVPFFYQLGVFVIGASCLLFFALRHLSTGLTRRTIVAGLSVFFAATALFLASVPWGL